MAISWQLRGLRGNYGMYVAVTGYTCQPSSYAVVTPLRKAAFVLATYSHFRDLDVIRG